MLIPIIPYQQRYLSQICSNDSSYDSLINTTSVWTTIKNRFWSLHIIVTRSNWAPDSLKARLRLPQTLHLRMRLGTPNLCFPPIKQDQYSNLDDKLGSPISRNPAASGIRVVSCYYIHRHFPPCARPWLLHGSAKTRFSCAQPVLCLAWPPKPAGVSKAAKSCKCHLHMPTCPQTPPQISHTAPKASKKQGPSANSDLMCTSNLCPINMSRYHCIQWLYPVKCNLIPSQQTHRMPHCTWSTTDLQLDSMLGGTDVKSLEISWLNVPDLKMGVYFPKIQDNPLGVGNLFSKLQVPGQSTRQEAAE